MDKLLGEKAIQKDTWKVNNAIRRWLNKAETFQEVGQFSKYKLRRNDRSSDSIIQLVGQLGSVRHFKLPLPTSSSESNCTFHFKLRNSLQIRIPSPPPVDYWFPPMSRIENIRRMLNNICYIQLLVPTSSCLELKVQKGEEKICSL